MYQSSHHDGLDLRLLGHELLVRLDVLHLTCFHGLEPTDKSSVQTLHLRDSRRWRYVSLHSSYYHNSYFHSKNLLIFAVNIYVCKLYHNLTTYSASAFTIIRIPYLHSLIQSSDFLYDATDLSLWSIAETGLALSACASTALRPLFRKFGSRLFATFKGSSEGRQSAWPSAVAGYTRNGRNNYYRYEENMEAQTNITTKITTNIVDSNNAIHLSRWMGDNDRGSAEADGGSNSSQAKLKVDEENGLSPADTSPGIRKTIVVSTHSVRI